jgi:hypothetical protein
MMMKKLVVTLLALSCLGLMTRSMAGELDLIYSDLLKTPEPISSGLMASVGGDQDRTFIDMSGEMKSGKEISMKKAMLLSLIFPGAGQYYADAKFKGQVFMGAEAAIWAGFIAYRVYGGWKKDNYLDYAAAHAGVDNAGKTDEFYDWLGFYDNREDFNQYGRLYYPDRAYLPDNSSFFWQWDSAENRAFFKELKNDSKRAFRNSTFLIGLAIANRVIAGIDTYRTVKSARAKLSALSRIGEYHFALSPKVIGANPSVKLTVTRKF